MYYTGGADKVGSQEASTIGADSNLYPVDEGTEFSYDVFLSFADEDREVVERELKEPLEASGYTVCWHHTAFIAGWTILQNMEHHIGCSRMVVVLLSNSFDESKFCQHELNIASQRMKHKNVACVLPVILEEGCNIPQELTRLTYLSVYDNSFFERLCQAIGKEVLLLHEQIRLLQISYIVASIIRQSGIFLKPISVAEHIEYPKEPLQKKDLCSQFKMIV